MSIGSASASGTCTSSTGCFTTALSTAPSPVAAGDPVTFTFTLYNQSSTQTLGSVLFTAPSGVTVTGANLVAPNPGTASSTATSAQFLDLSVAPGGSTQVQITATAPCSAPGTNTWSPPEAKPTSDFSGSGQDLAFGYTNVTNLSFAVSGTCSLAFVPTAEPATTTVGSSITSQIDSGSPTTAPVEVEVLDGNGNVATAQVDPVTLTLAANPGGVSSFSVTVGAVNGVASFVQDLVINTAGDGYAFAASSPGITGSPPEGLSATSSYFSILDTLQTCSSPSCATGGSGTNTSFSASTTGVTEGDFLGVGFGGVPSFACGSYVGVPLSDTADIATYEVLNTSGNPVSGTVSTIQEEINKQIVKQSGHPGASSWQICFGSTSPDPNYVNGTTSTGVIGGTTYYFGLLPDCSSTVSAPCIQARNKDQAGDVIITFLATDSVWRG